MNSKAIQVLGFVIQTAVVLGGIAFSYGKLSSVVAAHDSRIEKLELKRELEIGQKALFKQHLHNHLILKNHE